MTLKPNSKIYFMGIGGTGMATVAGLCMEAGHTVTGSDAGIYPPMSTMLEELGIAVKSPYNADNIKAINPDVVVVANALSRGNPEIEYVLANQVPYTSFPKLMGDLFLQHRQSIVVAGTHGKTTTTSLVAYVLDRLGLDPGFVIGGMPRDFTHSFRLGKGALFAIEGDEYDTAFFDKGPKFLHYHPQFLILNNLEFDHADIFKNVEEIEVQFIKLCQLMRNPKQIIANADDPGIVRVLDKCGLTNKVTRVSTLGKTADAAVRMLNASTADEGKGQPLWSASIQTPWWGTVNVRTSLSGMHNIANITQVLALLGSIQDAKLLGTKAMPAAIQAAIASFSGVRRRLDHLGSVGGVDIFEDFAHHPTAIKLVIEGFRKAYPGRRLIVAFEPRNATSRRNVFQDDFATSLSLADQILIGKCPVDERIPAAQRMDTKAMQAKIGGKAKAFNDNEPLLDSLAGLVQPGDAVIFMSSGSFSGVQYKLPEVLRQRMRPDL